MIYNSKVEPGSSMTNFDNSHRIMCVDVKGNTPEYVGFIGKELVRESMSLRTAISWLNAPAERHDTICPICKKALFKLDTVIAAEGELFCSIDCAREWKAKKLREQMRLDLDAWVNGMCEEVSAESVGLYESEDIYNG